MRNSFTYILSCSGLLGIIATQVFIIQSSEDILLWPSFLLFMAILPIKGLWQNRRYTFQWTGFLSMFFLCVGVSEFFVTASPQSPSFIMLCASILLYFGVVFHAKKLAHLEKLNADPEH